MREIKFRVWDKRKKEWLFRGKDIDAMADDIEGMCIGWESYEIMQYTGLKDKNGKEIYEGDIVKKYKRGFYDTSYGTYIVSWDEITVAFTTKDRDLSSGSFMEDIEFNYEVIGNIYENPRFESEGK